MRKKYIVRWVLPMLSLNSERTWVKSRLLSKETLPVLIELADIRGIFHIHTEFSDGVDSIEKMVAGGETHGTFLYRHFRSQ